ncbi:MAG: hypothetical protein CL678_16240 [Bdellovibrionaceae bacterium]|nr:hypothetical protein [Pseudobdellovibrionaceae bacterium]|tara:strand:- start:508 stop:924 length:417 start_codon:yes stop_codon:yes gene_type:complete
MKIHWIVLPLFLQVVLTWFVAIVNVRMRIASVREKKVSIKYYKTYEGSSLPSEMIQASRNYANLFELPTLFFAGVILTIVLEKVDVFSVGVCWLFFFSRVIHSVVHLTYNNVLHRLFVFVIGWVSVMVLWTYLMIQIW